jgi:hypothetical protein
MQYKHTQQALHNISNKFDLHGQNHITLFKQQQ